MSRIDSIEEEQINEEESFERDIEADAEPLANLINRVHNKQYLDSELRVPYLSTDQLSMLNIAMLAYNHTQRKLEPHPQTEAYYEDPQYHIPDRVRALGILAKFFGLMCKFPQEDPFSHLAVFDTDSFLRSLENQISAQIVDHVLGIFPNYNVHSDNLPLYAPLRCSVGSYFAYGNPNWQLSRKKLKETLKDDFTMQNNSTGPDLPIWYSALLGDGLDTRQLSGGTIGIFWRIFYNFYVQLTLSPYRSNSTKESVDKEIDEGFKELIKSVNRHLLCEPSPQNRLLLQIVLYVISDDEKHLGKFIESLRIHTESSIERYGQLNQADNGYSVEEQFIRKQLLTSGFINALLFQTNNFLSDLQSRREVQLGEIDVQKKGQAEIIHRKCRDLNEKIQNMGVPFWDFLLRVFFPESEHVKFELQRGLQKMLAQEQFIEFPITYPYYEKEIRNELSEMYLRRFPNQILQMLSHLSGQETVWKLLNTESLNEFRSFEKIKNNLTANQKQYVAIINKSTQIKSQDFRQFIEIWKEFHSAKSFGGSQSQEHTVELQFQVLMTNLSNNRIRPNFAQKVSLPLDKLENLQKVLMKFTGIVTSDPQRFKSYLQLVSHNSFGEKILNRLEKQQQEQFWSEWANAFLSDDCLIVDLIQNTDHEVQRETHSMEVEEERKVHQPIGKEGLHDPEIKGNASQIDLDSE